MNKKLIWIVIAVAVLAVIIYFVYRTRNNTSTSSVTDSLNIPNDFPDELKDLDDYSKKIVLETQNKPTTDIINCDSVDYSLKLAKALNLFDDLRRINEKAYSIWEQDKNDANWNKFQMALVESRNQMQVYNELRAKCFPKGPFIQI